MDPDDAWSPLAADWARHWGGVAAPATAVLLSGVGPGTALLDAGCGAGELLARAATLGARTAGCDPAPGMLAIAAQRAPGADLRTGGLDALPFPDAGFDVVTAVNALQFAADPAAALGEVRRVLRPGGRFAIANWAERRANDLDVLESVVAAWFEEEVPPDPPTRGPGGLADLLRAAGFADVTDGVVDTPWTLPDGDALVAGVLLGEDADVRAALRAPLLAAAEPFRLPEGGYRLRNRFRWAVGRA